MTSPNSDTRELIERIEAAGGPDREIDAAIARAVGRVPPHAGFLAADDVAWDKGLGYSVPRYSASMDAAMTLAPQGDDHWPQIIYTSTNPNNPHRQKDRAEIWVKGQAKPFRGHATTAALALCAATLKARASALAKATPENPS